MTRRLAVHYTYNSFELMVDAGPVAGQPHPRPPHPHSPRGGDPGDRRQKHSPGGRRLRGGCGAIWFAAQVFKIALLRHGKPPDLTTLIRWARAAS